MVLFCIIIIIIKKRNFRSNQSELFYFSVSASQPEFSTTTEFEQSSGVCRSVSYSQPADKVMLMTGPCHMVDELPDAAFNPRCIMRRMTRFFSKFDATTTMERLLQAIAGEIHIEVMPRGPGTLMVEARGQVSFWVSNLRVIKCFQSEKSLSPNKTFCRSLNSENLTILKLSA